MRQLILAGLFLTGAAASASAYNEKQENVLNNLAEALALDRLCSELHINGPIAAAAFAFYDLDISNESVKSSLEKRIQSISDDMSDHDEEIICMTGKFMYGPKGMSIKNLLLPE